MHAARDKFQSNHNPSQMRQYLSAMLAKYNIERLNISCEQYKQIETTPHDNKII